MAYSADYDASGVEVFTIPSFTFHSRSTLPIKIAYKSFNTGSSKKVCIPTCYGGLINTTLSFNGPDQIFDSYHVVVVAMLGNGEGSSPSNTPDFPKTLDYRDQINAQYALLTKHLGIEKLDAVVGFSMGGQQAYYWACMYPEFVANSIVICSSARTSGHNYAFLEGPIWALECSADYEKYKSEDVAPSRGLEAFGRAYCAWLTSAAWYRQRQYRKLGFEDVASYVDDQSKTMLEGWNAKDVFILAKMWQSGNIGVFADGDYEKALANIKCKVLVMPARTDQYFP